MYSNLICLSEFFEHCDLDYCIVKRPEWFPKYKKNSDLDILCSDRYQLKVSILTFLSKYRHITSLSIMNNPSKDCRRLHIDVYNSRSGKLDIKFDIIDSVSVYKKVKVNEGLKYFCLESKIHDGKSFIPNTACEMVFRMLEFQEYFELRPDKIKHLHFIQNHIQHHDEFVKIWQEYIEEDLPPVHLNYSQAKSKISKLFSRVWTQLTSLAISRKNNE